MTLTHECGHIVGGWMGGATLTDCDLAPWRMPYSLHAPDPRPLMTLWSGPMLGVIVPLLAAAVIQRPWSWFVADFCVLANGAYLALAWLAGDRFLDTPRLLAAGAHPISIVLFVVSTTLVGYVRFRNDCMGVFSPPPPDKTPK
ncbi:MAG: hypothetical protein AAF670_02845 [Planctomycetota bacterium]